MKVLVINCGSSSLKYQLLNMPEGNILAKGICERIGIDGQLTQNSNGAKNIWQIPMPTHGEAIKSVFKALTDPDVGVIASLDEISAVGHRVLHGGEEITHSVIVDDHVLDVIDANIPLGPLHNPANSLGIKECRKLLPNVPQVAVFDTAFHQSMPPKAYMYALPYEMYEKYHIRRYGFHGTSHMYVSHRCAELEGKRPEELKIITCHLGNGSSICAVDGGKCVDTTMGLTPLEGTPMGTRCGSIDPAIVTFLMDKLNVTPKEMNNLMNKQSGVQGLTGISSDFRDINAAANNGDEKAKLALDMFCYSVKKYIGAYYAAMGGCDAIVFTAGVGENDKVVRAGSVEGLEDCFGIKIDPVKNLLRGEEVLISTPDSKVHVWVIPTNEELAIAQETMRLTEV